jgi:hypothetical protein
MGDDPVEQEALPPCRADLLLEVAHLQGEGRWLDPNRTDFVAGQTTETPVHLLEEVRRGPQVALQ